MLCGANTHYCPGIGQRQRGCRAQEFPSPRILSVTTPTLPYALPLAPPDFPRLLMVSAVLDRVEPCSSRSPKFTLFLRFVFTSSLLPSQAQIPELFPLPPPRLSEIALRGSSNTNNLLLSPLLHSISLGSRFPENRLRTYLIKHIHRLTEHLLKPLTTNPSHHFLTS